MAILFPLPQHTLTKAEPPVQAPVTSTPVIRHLIVSFPLVAAVALVASSFFPFPFQAQAAAAVNPVIPVRIAQLTQADPRLLATPQPQFFRLVPFVATQAPIPFRVATLAQAELAAQFGASSYRSYTFFEAASRPVIPFRQSPAVREDPQSVPKSLFFPVVSAPQAQAASPVIGFRYGQFRMADAPALVSSSVFRFSFFSQSAPPIPFRISRAVQESDASIATASYFKFPYTVQAVNPANPIIPFRKGPLHQEEASLVFKSQFFALIPFVQAAGTTNPVISFRMAPLVQQTLDVPGRAAYYQSYTFVELASKPVIVFRISPLPTAEPQSIITAAYFKFPYTSGVATPANPAIPIRVIVSALDAPLKLVQPTVLPFPYTTFAVAPANPVPAMRYGPSIEAALQALPQSAFFAFPFPSVVAQTNPVIPLRMGQWIGDHVEPLQGIQGYQPFPYFIAQAPANTVIPICIRRLGELQEQQRMVVSGYMVWQPFSSGVTPPVQGIYIPTFRSRRR